MKEVETARLEIEFLAKAFGAKSDKFYQFSLSVNVEQGYIAHGSGFNNSC